MLDLASEASEARRTRLFKFSVETCQSFMASILSPKLDVRVLFILLSAIHLTMQTVSCVICLRNVGDLADELRRDPTIPTFSIRRFKSRDRNCAHGACSQCATLLIDQHQAEIAQEIEQGWFEDLPVLTCPHCRYLSIFPTLASSLTLSYRAIIEASTNPNVEANDFLAAILALQDLVAHLEAENADQQQQLLSVQEKKEAKAKGRRRKRSLSSNESEVKIYNFRPLPHRQVKK